MGGLSRRHHGSARRTREQSRPRLAAPDQQIVRKKFARGTRRDVLPVCHDVQIVVEQVGTVRSTAEMVSHD